MITEDLKWDSAFFRKKISSVILESKDTVPQWKQMLSSSHADLIYLRFADDLSDDQNNFLKSLQPDISVTNMTFEKIPNLKEIPENINIRAVDRPDDFLYSMVLDCGKFSRFYLDPMLRPDYPRLYGQWLTNAFTKENWHCIISSEDRQVSGLSVFSRDPENEGHIELLTVNEFFQRKKIGHSLLQASENFLIRNYGISKISVKTQENNSPACLCYQKFGYLPCKKEHICHIWRKG